MYYIEHSEASQMNRVAAKNRAKKCAAEMYFISDSWIPEILRFTLASPNSQRFFRCSKRVQNGPVWLKGQHFTGLTCTRGLRRGGNSAKVSSLLTLLHILSIELTFENFRQEASQKSSCYSICYMYGLNS